MTPDLSGITVLIVEDEYFIASDLRRALSKAGAAVLGPASTLAGAMALMDEQAPDVAVLDVNLEGATSYPIADRLLASGTPFVFLTGYDGGSLPDAYRHLSHIAKPFSMRAVIEHVAQLGRKEADR